MHKPAIACLKDYKLRMKEGREDNWDFNPNKIGIKGDFSVWDEVRREGRERGTVEEGAVELKTS